MGYRHTPINFEELRAARIDRASLRRIWRFLSPYKLLLGLYLLAIVAATVIAVLPPLLVKSLIDSAIPKHSLSQVNVLAAGLVGLALATTAINLVNKWFASRIGEGLIYDLRTALYDHVQRMPISFFTRTQTGSLMSRLSSDVLDAQNAVGTVASVLTDVFTLVVTLAVMWSLNWQITGLSLLIIPGLIVLDRVMARRISRLSRRRMDLNAAMSTTMNERFNVAGALLVKLFGRPDEEQRQFALRAAAVRDTGVQQALLSRVLYAALSLVGAVGTAAVYWLGAREVVNGTLKLGVIVALAAYVTRLYAPLTDLASTRVNVLTAMVSFDRVFEVLDAPRIIDDKAGALSLPRPVAGRIEVSGVSFRYPPASEVSIASLEASGAQLSSDQNVLVLNDVSFTAEPGTMTALVGPSGAGKTTLSTLLSRLHDPTAGAVRIDGHDLRDVTLASVSQAVGVVTQDAHLFHDTIAANLRYAAPEATDEELQQACRAARIHDVIAALPDRYDTIVGERGYRLSGGEKQRLAIARVLLKDPAIMVLDEATAHLDSETELLIQQALAVALAGRTSVVIAHRLSTIQAADQILVVADGRIVERGRHDQLIAGGGLYAELYETQYARGSSPVHAGPVLVP
ncbi:MAG: ABC transporter ATP-binding protein/permease [Actinomycetota bacterium]|nr:ABC transporter ATP-binding protein/permease [Actinomycetota bacterium]